jgi:hypothetical protein
MSACEVCRNEYAKAFTVTLNGKTHTFDSFECAIHALAPLCAHCGCRVIGHGIDADDKIFCCAHCARHEGYKGARDHIEISSPPLFIGDSDAGLQPEPQTHE